MTGTAGIFLHPIGEAISSKVDAPPDWFVGHDPIDSPEPAAWNAFYDRVYAHADGDPGRLPWAIQAAHPAMVEWLAAEGCGCVRPGAVIVVVGCGLGDDVAELAGRGYDVCGFDVSPTAIEWAKRRHPEHAGRFITADLFELPTSLTRRADLVVEIATLQSFPLELRQRGAASIASVARPRGAILVIASAGEGASPGSLRSNPPYPFTNDDLASVFQQAGWAPAGSVDDVPDAQSPTTRRLRMLLRKA